MAFYSPQESPKSSTFRRTTVLAIIGRGQSVLLVRKRAQLPWQLPDFTLRQNNIATTAAIHATKACTGLVGRRAEFVGYNDNQFHDDVFLGFWVTTDPKTEPTKPEEIIAIAWHNVNDLPSVAPGHFAIISAAKDKF
ncbi:MAG: NUDIX hydrolase [Candidatus Woesebacteria bacterium]